VLIASHPTVLNNAHKGLLEAHKIKELQHCWKSHWSYFRVI